MYYIIHIHPQHEQAPIYNKQWTVGPTPTDVDLLIGWTTDLYSADDISQQNVDTTAIQLQVFAQDPARQNMISTPLLLSYSQYECQATPNITTFWYIIHTVTPLSLGGSLRLLCSTSCERNKSLSLRLHSSIMLVGFREALRFT